VVTADGAGVPTPFVVDGVFDDAGSNGVQVDVGGHQAEGVSIFDEHAFEPFFEQGSFAIVGEIVPGGEALFKVFDVLGEVEHAAAEAVEFAFDEGVPFDGDQAHAFEALYEFFDALLFPDLTKPLDHLFFRDA